MRMPRFFRMFSALAAALLVSVPAFSQGGFAGAGFYEITNVKSNRLMAVDPSDRMGVVQSASPGDEAVWDIQPGPGGFFFIRNSMTGNALEALDNRNSVPVRANPFHGRPSQQWRLEPGKDGNPLIVSSFGKVLDIPDGSDRTGVRVQIYDRNGDSNQRFMFRAVAGRQGGAFGGGRRGPFGNLGGPRGGAAARVLPCSSDDGRRNYCSADTSGGVRMTRQVSGSPCRENGTWGWDRSGIWVDRGCRAEFEVGGGRSFEQPRRGGGAQAYVVRCASDDGRRTYCPASTGAGVRMVRQISGSPCREGQTWGWDRRGIWVDRGCRAEFEVGRR